MGAAHWLCSLLSQPADCALVGPACHQRSSALPGADREVVATKPWQPRRQRRKIRLTTGHMPFGKVRHAFDVLS